MRADLATTLPPVVSIITGHFREGTGYSVIRPRGTDDLLLMLTLGGEGRIGFDGGALICKRGDLTIFRPGTPHDYATHRSAGEWEFVWAHFVPRPHQAAHINGWSEHRPGLIYLDLVAEGADTFLRTRDALLEMHRRAISGLPRRDEFALISLDEALLWCDSIQQKSLETPVDARINRAIEYMRARVGKPVALSDLARLANLSTSRFSHLFREQTGQTPQVFLEHQRMERAEQLLALTGLTVTAIAAAVGYENPFYFTLRFKKRTGCSPTEWRNRQQTPVSS